MSKVNGKAFYLAGLLLALSIFPVSAYAFAGYSSLRPIDVNQLGSGTLTNFTALINQNTSVLGYDNLNAQQAFRNWTWFKLNTITGNGSATDANMNYNNFTDIAVTNAGDTLQLPHYVENNGTSGGQANNFHDSEVFSDRYLRWDFTNTNGTHIIDTSGNNRHGEWETGAAGNKSLIEPVNHNDPNNFTLFGQRGSWQVDDNNQIIQTPATLSLFDADTNSFTVEVWVKPRETTRGDILKQWASCGGACRETMFVLGINVGVGSTWGFYVSNRGVGDWGCDAGTLNTGGWTHMVGQYNVSNTTGILFINGTRVCGFSYGGGTSSPSSDNAFAFGVSSTDNVKPLADVDDVNVYSSALEPTTIRNRFLIGLSSLGTAGGGATPPTFSNNITSPTSPQTYPITNPTWFNITWTNGTNPIGHVWLRSNITGTSVDYIMRNATPSAFFWTFNDSRTGRFTYQFFANDTSNNQNSTAQLVYVVNPGPANTTILLNGSYGNISTTFNATTNATAFTNVTGGNISLYMNGVLVNSSTTATVIQNVIQLAADTYNYTAVLTHENYTAPSISSFLTVNKANSNLTLTSSAGFNLFQGSSTTITCTAVMPITLKFDSAIVSSPHTITPSLGVHTIFCGIADTQNYTNPNSTVTLSVNALTSCTNKDTFGFFYSATTSGSITTLNFTEAVNASYVKPDLSDVNFTGIVNPSSNVTANYTNGYFLIVNTSGITSFNIAFGNYIVNNSWPGNTTPIQNIINVTDYTKINPVMIVSILDEFQSTQLYPPNSTVIIIPSCSLGTNYITVNKNNTVVMLAGRTYFDKVAVQVKYSADSFYSRQRYLDSNVDISRLNLYVVDAFQVALDRIDFRMLDINYYNAKLQLYKTLNNTDIIITEGFFDAAHFFSAYLAEDFDYKIMATVGSKTTEFGTITVVTPAQKDLGQTYIDLNPQAQLIADNILMNAYRQTNDTELRVIFSDSLNQTRLLNITVYFANGTIFQNVSYSNTSSVDLIYNVSAYPNEDFRVDYSFTHDIFGNSPVKYTVPIFAGILFTIPGVPAIAYRIVSLILIIAVGGMTVRESLVVGVPLTIGMVVLLIGIKWITLSWVAVAFMMVIGFVAIMNYFKQGGE